MRFEWDEVKNERNLAKHNVSFEAAALAFDDVDSLTQRDESTGEEERWITLGSIGSNTVLFVVHMCLEQNDEEVIRIISARAATRHERSAYEEAKQGTKTRRRRDRGYQRRRY
ncbi:MAG: BrnT family toxin [Acidobacteriia bacterium]|nr:BrnT family toxin [Terriglobia bacterium]